MRFIFLKVPNSSSLLTEELLGQKNERPYGQPIFGFDLGHATESAECKSLYGYNQHRNFATSDAGENWTNILSGADVKRITYSPLNDGVMVASLFSTMYQDTSIRYTTDAGQTWTTITPEQLNYINSYSIAYDFDGNNINAYLATTDLGVMKVVIENLNLSVNHPDATKSMISVYPNPASNEINVTASNNAFEIQNTAIYSITGKKFQKVPKAKSMFLAWLQEFIS